LVGFLTLNSFNYQQNRLPSQVRNMKDDLIHQCLLTGDTPHCSAVVMDFRKYVKAVRLSVRTMDNPPDKLGKERDQLKILQRNVTDRCRDGSSGIATAIYNFLTDSAGNKRTQGAMRCIKSVGAKVESPVVAPIQSPRVTRSGQSPKGWYSQKRPQNLAQGFTRSRPPGLKCFICQQNHFQSECPMSKK
jgi:hypothetical protein